MNLFSLFRSNPSRKEIAALRDRVLIAETQVMLLRDIVDHPRKITREPRKDKGSVIAARHRVTDQLRDYAASVRAQGRGRGSA